MESSLGEAPIHVPSTYHVASAFDALTPTERAAAIARSQLDDPVDGWKPIKFLNDRHYDALIRANMLDADLARQITASSTIAQVDDKGVTK